MRQPPDRNGRARPEPGPRHLIAAAPTPPSKGRPAHMVTRARAACPLLRAAAALGDPAVIAAVEYWHPAGQCPAARRGRAA